MSYWNDKIIDKSRYILIELKKNYDFILIGGWAVYYYTKSIKSKDIDIIIEFNTLKELNKNFPIQKNNRLNKYETNIEGVSIDIYLPYYSKLVIPPEKILKNFVIIEGFKLPKIEYLLALKQQAELERPESVKGLKDRIDIIAILLSQIVDLKKYAKILEENRPLYLKRLYEIINNGKSEFKYLNITNPRKIKQIKQTFLNLLKELI